MKNRRQEGLLRFDEMNNGVFHFLWATPNNGFIFVEEEKVRPHALSEFDKSANRGPWLMHKKHFDTVDYYPPLEIVNLHRKFANLWDRHKGEKEIPIESILQFAEKYGHLGHYFNCTVQGRPQQELAESYGYWESSISIMACLIDLWDMVKVEDKIALKKYAKWQRFESGQYMFQLEYKPVKNSFGIRLYEHEKSHDGTIRWKVGDIINPVKDDIINRINKQLEGHVSPELFNFLEPLEVPIYMVPDCLLSGMYLLFALEISGFISEQKPPIICLGCQTLFQPDHGHQKYCSESCRWKMNKRKQRKKPIR